MQHSPIAFNQNNQCICIFSYYLHAIWFVVIEKKEVLVWNLHLNQTFPTKDHSIQAPQLSSRLLCIFSSSKIKFLCVFGGKKEVFLPISKLSHNCLLSILLLERQHKSYTSWSIHFIMHGWNAFFLVFPSNKEEYYIERGFQACSSLLKEFQRIRT